MPRAAKTPIAAMREQMEAAKTRVTKLEEETKSAKLQVTRFEQCIKILEAQEPTPTLTPASAATTAAKGSK